MDSSPQPSMPKQQRGGALQYLLQQFGSQTSATSATKARRISASRRDQAADSKRPTATHLTPMAQPNRPPASPASPTVNTPRRSQTESAGELKMELRKRARRTSRRKGVDIIESDTARCASPPGSGPSKTAAPPRLDTARTRLRDDIAHRTRTKANNFFVANKDCFLPLLPESNHIAKLVAEHDAAGIVEYEDLAEQPEGLRATMKPYQLSGLSFLVHLHNNGFSGILGDEMGLGKTLQTLSLFQFLEERDRKAALVHEELRPYLVICPLSVLESWANEAVKWVPGLRVLRFHGTTSERQHLKKVAAGMEDFHGNETVQSKSRKASRKAGNKVSGRLADNQGSNSYKIIVTTYETFQVEQSWFKRSFLWRYVVLDEGHRIKSAATQISSALRGITAEYRLILTGTPLQNNLMEMWALLAWLYPDVFTQNTVGLFKESFDLGRGRVDRQVMDDARRLLELVMLRRMKDSPGVNLDLPPKEEVLLYVPLAPMQRFWYMRLLTRVDAAMLDDLFADGRTKEKQALEQDRDEDDKLARVEQLDNSIDGLKWEETATIMKQAIQQEQTSADKTTHWQKLMNLIMQLRKCCSHPYLLPGAIPVPYVLGQHVIQASGKFILLEKLLKHTIFEEKKKVLIFSSFTGTLDCCEDLLSLIGNHGRGFDYLRLDGSTGRARRNLHIRLFNNMKSNYKVMLLSTRAGGLGINLTSAESVIFLDEDWNPQITLQAEARAHRIGQTKKVTIYKLCTQGTVEEQMMGRIRKKLYLSTKITESMRTKHGRASLNGKVATTENEDMPHMDTSQLKSLVRRGAQTLSHPEINVTDMLSWDLDTMLEKCQDKPADPSMNPDGDVDEDEWLSMIERVACNILDGKKVQKADPKTDASTPASSINRKDRRIGKNTTVMIDGFAVNKDSINCGEWEAVPTLAGKDPRLAEPMREKQREIIHEGHCLTCFDELEAAHAVECKSCPRAYHFDCLDPEYQAKVQGFSGFYCPQHQCDECGRRTANVGNLIYRCRWCPRGFCEDCLETGQEELVGENLPEFEMLGEGPFHDAFYIKCPSCIETERDTNHREWIQGMEHDYKEQHNDWLNDQEEQLRVFEEERNSLQRKQSVDSSRYGRSAPGHRLNPYLDLDEEDVASPPSLTDTSLETLAAIDSGFSTPRHGSISRNQVKRRANAHVIRLRGEIRDAKRARRDTRDWIFNKDPLKRMGLMNDGV